MTETPTADEVNAAKEKYERAATELVHAEKAILSARLTIRTCSKEMQDAALVLIRAGYRVDLPLMG